jgi:hypothetical protein
MQSRISSIALLAVAWTAVQTSAQVAPSTRPYHAASPPSIETIVSLMREEQYDKASAQMDLLFAAVPPNRRTRPMVLNRAVLDLRHANTTMRVVKELTEYLVNDPVEDEPATNILGSALDAAVRQNPQAIQSAAFEAGAKEWQRRNQAMDHSRAGWRRWGAKWLSDDEFRGIDTQYKQYRAQLAEQQETTYRARQRYESLYGRQGSVSPGRSRSLPFTYYLPFGHTCTPSRSQLLPHVGAVGQMAGREEAPIAEPTLRQTAYTAKADAEAQEKALEEMVCHRPRAEFPRAYPAVAAAELKPPPGPSPIRPTTSPATHPATTEPMPPPLSTSGTKISSPADLYAPTASPPP